MSGSSTARKQITVVVEPAQYERIVREAKVERRPVASLVRNLIADALAERCDQEGAR
jgi:hypothetical protein